MNPIARAAALAWYWFARRPVFALAPRGGVCAEVGVWKGDFSQKILDELRPQELHLIDPWLFAPDFPKRWYGGKVAQSQGDMDAIVESVRRRFAAAPAVRIHRGKSLEMVARFPEKHFDWVYIDGDHSYSAVLDDLIAWYPKVKSQGSLVLDDYYWKDEAGKRTVKAAIETFLGKTEVAGQKLVAGQFVIRAR
jgi:hypothetical protein